MQIDISPAVRAALAGGRPVVALESTLIAHGLPQPSNLEVAQRIEDRVRAAGAHPATIAVLDGRPTIGVDDRQLAHVARGELVKLSERDLPVAVTKGLDGATTVSATASLAHHVGIRVFATGGLGGVHRDAHRSWDVSADLTTLARTPVIVVCAGVKSILDVPATLEHLETLGVTVVGYRTARFAGFYLADSGHPVPWSVDDADDVARVHRAAAAMGSMSGLVVANPLPAAAQLDPQLHERALASGLERAEAQGVHGAALTPFLLDHFHTATGGRSLEVNVELVLRNVELGAQIAIALSP